MIDTVRLAFEQKVYPSFRTGHGLRRKPTGKYVSDTLEDHWQTYQEGWAHAIDYLKNKHDPGYSDIVSDGGVDPR